MNINDIIDFEEITQIADKLHKNDICGNCIHIRVFIHREPHGDIIPEFKCKLDDTIDIKNPETYTCFNHESMLDED